jgi:hypothetical protein
MVVKYNMKYIIIIFSFFIIGCGSYTHTSFSPKIKSLLAITEAGDTVSVSMKDFERQKYDNYTRFNYNNNWYWNNWHYNNNWGWNRRWDYQPNRYWWNNDPRYTNPNRVYRSSNRPKVKPKPRPKTRPEIPRTRPQRVRVNTPRTRTTPSVIQRNNVGRRSSGGSRGLSNIKKKQ